MAPLVMEISGNFDTYNLSNPAQLQGGRNKAMHQRGDRPILYGLALELSILLAFFLCVNVTGPGQDVAPDGHSYVTFGHGLTHGVIITITVVLPILATLAIFEKRSLNWVIVNVLYWMITICLMAGILSAWR